MEEGWNEPKVKNYIQIIEDDFTEPNIKYHCAQLTAGTLLLSTEVWIYDGIPEHLCVLYDFGVVVDEFHFVLHCIKCR